MAHVSIISSQSGEQIFEGAPRYIGAYLKPGYLEFQAIGSPTAISWHVGDYVVYPRTGKTYRLYRTPQIAEQGNTRRYGAAFLYENVQFFDDSKQLELCPFIDLVPGDNTIHFSTQNVVSFFGKPLNVAERVQACLENQYGAGTWEVRIVTTTDPDLLELLDTEVEFSVSGASCQQALDKVYELWNGLGWIHTVENGVNVITIGASNVRTNANTTVPFAYGNGLVRVERSIANVDEIGTRLFAYGSMKNMDATYYRGLNIYHADSVDIEHLMIPLSEWGLTDGQPDARKAFIEDASAIDKLGLIPRTAYFDGTGDLPDIHPTIERMTIGEVYDAGGAGYIPNLSKWSRDQRIDEIVSAVNPTDHGTSAEQGQKYTEDISSHLAALTDTFINNDTVSWTIFSVNTNNPGRLTFNFGQEPQPITLTTAWTPQLDLKLAVYAGGKRVEAPLTIRQASSTAWQLILPESVVVSGAAAGLAEARIEGVITNTAGGQTTVDGSFSTIASTAVTGGVEYELPKTFTVTVPQIGFDIEKYAALGNGKTISMKTGMCAGRDFEIKSVKYLSSTDSWELTLYRSVDEDLNIMFPNADYEIEAQDQYVLLDIAMPQMYVTVASNRLLEAAQRLLADISVEQPFYAPQIDAKRVYDENRVLLEGMWMHIRPATEDDTLLESSDPALLQERQLLFLATADTSRSDAYVIIDSIIIDENGSNIPTYDVTLRERKGLDWTENVGKSASAKSSVSMSGGEQEHTGGVSSIGMTVPTGLIVQGSPVTSAGILKVELQEGYKIPLISELAGYFEVNPNNAKRIDLKSAYDYLGPRKGLIFDANSAEDTAAHLEVVTKTINGVATPVLHSRLPFYSDSFVSAGGLSSGGGSAGGGNASLINVVTETGIGTARGTITNGTDTITVYSKDKVDSLLSTAGRVQSVSLVQGSANGTLRLVVNDVQSADVAVMGINTAAYKAVSFFVNELAYNDFSPTHYAEGYLATANANYDTSTPHPFNIIGGNQTTILQILPGNGLYSGQYAFGFGNGKIAFRNKLNTTSWSAWMEIPYLPIGGGIMQGNIRIASNGGIFTNDGVYALVGCDASYNASFGPNAGTTVIRSGSTNLIHSKNGTSYEIWDESNSNLSTVNWTAKTMTANAFKLAGGTPTLTWDSNANAWHLSGNFYADGFISAGGLSPGGGSGGIDPEAMWQLLGDSTNEQIAASHLTTALNGYATQNWVTGRGYITGINSSMVTTALGYTPVSPTDLTTALGGYLPLSAGLSNPLTGDLYIYDSASKNSGVGIMNDTLNGVRRSLIVLDPTITDRPGTEGDYFYIACHSDGRTYFTGPTHIGTGIVNNNIVFSSLTGCFTFGPRENSEQSTYKVGVVGSFNATTIYQNGVALGSNAFSSTAYLPLAGGTMNNTNLVTNLNADLLDGVHNGALTAAVLKTTSNPDWIFSVDYDETRYFWLTAKHGNDTISTAVYFANEADTLDGQHGSYYNNLLAFYDSGATSADSVTYPLSLLNIGTPSSAWWYVTTMYYSAVGSTAASQIATSYSGSEPQMYIRQKNGTWTSWEEVYHSGNSNLSTVSWACSTLTVSGLATMSGGARIDGGLLLGGDSAGKAFIGDAVSGLGGGYTGGLFWAYGNHPLYFYTNASSRMIITGDGNVGIGTSSPAYTLDVRGSGYFANDLEVATTYGIQYDISGAKYYSLWHYHNGDIYLGYGTALAGKNTHIDGYNIAFRTGSGLANEVLNLYSNGDVRIRNTLNVGASEACFYNAYYGNGSASAGPAAGSLKTGTIGLCTASNDYGLYAWCNYSTGQSNMQSGRADGANTEMYSLCLNPMGGNVGVNTFSPSCALDVAGVIHSSTGIYTEGYVTAGATSSSSDERLKSDIKDFGYSAEMLMALRPREWDWNEKSYMKGHAAGVVAQELQQVMPYAIVERQYLSVNYDMLHGLEIAGLQDHESRIRQLERENAELKRRLNMN